MTRKVNINGELVPGDRPVITLDNRAFHYGDGLFESIRVLGGMPRFLDAHWARLSTGAELLRIKLLASLDRAAFERSILELAQANGIESGRCRFTLYRAGAGHYRPESDEGAYTIELTALDEPTYRLNPQGLMVDIWPEM